MKRTHSGFDTPTSTQDGPRKHFATPSTVPSPSTLPLHARASPASSQLGPPEDLLGSPTRQLEAAFTTPEAATLPETPQAGRSRTKPRTARPSRHDSLMDTKVAALLLAA